MNIFKKTLHKITTGLAVGTFAVAVLMTLSAPAQAAGQERVVTQASKADVDALSAKIRKSMPGLVIDSLKPSVVPGLWELVSGGDVAYFTADGVHMIQGTMFNVADRRNISEDALTDQRVKALNSISKEALIVYPAKGKAKHTITVFTDPSCP